MKKGYYIILGILISVALSSCTNDQKDSKEVYNQKANEIIVQVIKESNCDCLLEIPRESLIETSLAENPSYDIRSSLVKELNTQNNASLDSLVNVSKDFRLDTNLIQKTSVKIVTLENLRSAKKDNGNEILKMCPKGILCINKPIFNKTFQKAVLNHGFAFTCTVVLPFPTYEFKKDKWERVKRKN